MNLRISGSEQRGERRMAIDRDRLMQTASENLRRLDGIAAPVAIVAALLMIFALDVQWALAILLSLGVYAGVALLRPAAKELVESIPDPVNPDLEAVTVSRDASERITAAIASMPDESAQELLTEVVAEIDKMLDAFEEDAQLDASRLAAAPLFQTKMVGPLDQYLAKALRLRRRGVRLAAGQFERLVSEDLPLYGKAAEEFYQEYHNQEVLDLEALREILKFNLDSIDHRWLDDDHDLEGIDQSKNGSDK
jgi:hypothetical protein